MCNLVAYFSEDDQPPRLAPDRFRRVNESQVDACSYTQPNRTVFRRIVADSDDQIEIHLAKLIDIFRYPLVLDANLVQSLYRQRMHISRRLRPCAKRPPLVSQAGVYDCFSHL